MISTGIVGRAPLVLGLDSQGALLHDHLDCSRGGYLGTLPDLLYALRETPRTLLVAGITQNAALIAALLAASQCVYVASPAFSRGRCADGLLALSLEDASCLSLPDWVRLRESDQPTYALRAAPSLQTAVAHPAWPVVTLCDLYDFDAGCRLLTTIGDPRWFRDPLHPNRYSRVYAYLGLSGRARGAAERERYEDVLRLWYYPRAIVSVRERFLWRAYVGAANSASGRLRVSRLFVRLLCEIWLDRIVPRSAYNAGSYFRADEISAFQTHREGGGVCPAD